MAALAVLATLAACGLPRDPGDTLEHARERGSLRVGIDDGGERAHGPQREMVEGFAQGLGLAVEWHPAPLVALLARLEKHELDLVVAGQTAGEPWSSAVGESAPWPADAPNPWTIAAPPGENRLLYELDRHILAASRRAGG